MLGTGPSAALAMLADQVRDGAAARPRGLERRARGGAGSRHAAAHLATERLSKTAADAVPQHTIIFTKPSSSIAGPFDDIPLWPGLDEAVDYEAELAVVIGRGGRFIPPEQAMAHVFGYTILNDVTARDLQRVHTQCRPCGNSLVQGQNWKVREWPLSELPSISGSLALRFPSYTDRFSLTKLPGGSYAGRIVAAGRLRPPSAAPGHQRG